jgi:hypothetical protein
LSLPGACACVMVPNKLHVQGASGRLGERYELQRWIHLCSVYRSASRAG